jgi:hypothetical protein
MKEKQWREKREEQICGSSSDIRNLLNKVVSDVNNKEEQGRKQKLREI